MRSGTAAARVVVAVAACALLLLLALSLQWGSSSPRLAFAEAHRRLASRAGGCPGAPFRAASLAAAGPGELVLVTGGAGFIGSAVVALLLEQGYAVRVLDNLSTGKRANLPEHARLELVVGDVADAATCLSVTQGASFVLHLAAFSRVAPSLSGGADAARACVRANVEGTMNVLDAASRAGVRRLVYAGSSTAYGGGGDAEDELATRAYGARRAHLLPAWELDAPGPSSPYAATKLMGEHLVASWQSTYGLNATVLRLFMVYGPREHASGESATVVARFVAAVARGKAVSLEGGGTQTRDFVHVSDVARAFVLAMQAGELPRRAVINVGSGVATSIRSLAELLSAGPHELAPPRRLDLQDTLADTCAAAALLGWAPQVGLRVGLSEMLAQERRALSASIREL